MKLFINGEQHLVDNVSNVAELLAAFHIDHKILVVELNQTIVDKSLYQKTQLQDEDRLEIVHFVGGG